MSRTESFSREDLIACGNGELIGTATEGRSIARLPLPNMLMMDRITKISDEGGEYGKGVIIAELDITPDLWFFDCHFKTDPVMPGCLGVDAMWQLAGFYLSWDGSPGKGRALGSGEIKFFGQVLPTAKKVTYRIDVKRILDFRDAKQREELRTLAKSADILINSYRPGVLNTLGLDPESTTALNPNGMIYVSISCYGPGPWSDRGGYDSLAQAATGYSLAHSGLTSSMDQKPSLVPMSAPNDYICAFLAVAGILTALQRRQEEGGSFHVKVSLAQAAMWTMKFGYRDKPHRSQLKNLFGSNLLDFSSLKEAKQFLQVQRSDFGEISSLKIPIHFKNPKIKERYRYPSVAFGTHLPRW